MTSELHNFSGKSDVQCPSQCPDRSAVERVNRELIVAKLTALLTVTALMCLNIHSFWSHTIRSSTLSIGSKTIELRVCDIPARTGWFFQRIWPRVEGLLSELVPAVLLLPLSLYGLCLLHLRKRDAQPPHSITKTQQTIPKLIVRSVENVELPLVLCQGTAIEMPARDISLARLKRQTHQRQRRVKIETREQLRVVLLFALLTSMAALQAGAGELVAALSPTFIEYSKREWLFVLLISHLLSLLLECFTLPLCLALSAHFRRHFCTLLCF